MDKKLVTSGSPMEKPIGFSRGVRVGNIIAIAGTAPLEDNGATACPDDMYGQTKRCLSIMINAVIEAGGKKDLIYRTRIMLKDISQWKEAARAHGEIFSDIRPACTFVEVKGFIDPMWLVETEADAWIE